MALAQCMSSCTFSKMFFPLSLIFIQNFKRLYSCVQRLLREELILERGVFEVTSALKSSSKTNINTEKLNATTWWSPSFGSSSDPMYHSRAQLLTPGEKLSIKHTLSKLMLCNAFLLFGSSCKPHTTEKS